MIGDAVGKATPMVPQLVSQPLTLTGSTSSSIPRDGEQVCVVWGLETELVSYSEGS